MDEFANLQLTELQETVDDLVMDSSKARVAQCARVLATYVALYKHHFGELTHEQTVGLGEDVAAADSYGEAVYLNGLRELLETLELLEDAEYGSVSTVSRLH